MGNVIHALHTVSNKHTGHSDMQSIGLSTLYTSSIVYMPDIIIKPPPQPKQKQKQQPSQQPQPPSQPSDSTTTNTSATPPQ